MKVQINDCTIRDGGYLLEKNLPNEYVHSVIDSLVSAGIDIIEIGFLQNETNNDSIVYNNSVGSRKYLPKNADASRFTGFCDNSRYSIEKLDNKDGKSFEYLRISFAKHESKEALIFVSEAKKKGYKVFANPMDAPSYDSDERSKMISEVNKIRPYAFSIVDTFGSMHLDELQSIFTQIDRKLDKKIKIGLHTHNNIQLANALSEVMIGLAVESDRDIVIDGSLYGMGRGAGNASTEVIASYLNEKYNKEYDLGMLFDTIEKYIIPHKDSLKWGYNLQTFICGKTRSHVDNISYLKKKGQYSAKALLHIISSLELSKRKRYGPNYSKTDFTDLEIAYKNYLNGGEL